MQHKNRTSSETYLPADHSSAALVTVYHTAQRTRQQSHHDVGSVEGGTASDPVSAKGRNQDANCDIVLELECKLLNVRLLMVVPYD